MVKKRKGRVKGEMESDWEKGNRRQARERSKGKRKKKVSGRTSTNWERQREGEK